jgi:hypothetical protein
VYLEKKWKDVVGGRRPQQLISTKKKRNKSLRKNKSKMAQSTRKYPHKLMKIIAVESLRKRLRDNLIRRWYGNLRDSKKHMKLQRRSRKRKKRLRLRSCLERL